MLIAAPSPSAPQQSDKQAIEWRRINDNEMTLTGSGGTGTDWIVKFKRTK